MYLLQVPAVQPATYRLSLYGDKICSSILVHYRIFLDYTEYFLLDISVFLLLIELRGYRSIIAVSLLLEVERVSTYWYRLHLILVLYSACDSCDWLHGMLASLEQSGNHKDCL